MQSDCATAKLPTSLTKSFFHSMTCTQDGMQVGTTWHCDILMKLEVYINRVARTAGKGKSGNKQAACWRSADMIWRYLKPEPNEKTPKVSTIKSCFLEHPHMIRKAHYALCHWRPSTQMQPSSPFTNSAKEIVPVASPCKLERVVWAPQHAFWTFWNMFSLQRGKGFWLHFES